MVFEGMAHTAHQRLLVLFMPKEGNQMDPITWTSILDQFNLDGLAGAAQAGVAALIPVTIVSVGYLLFRNMAKKAPRA